MLNFRQSPFMRTVVLPLTLLSFVSACHKWTPVEDPVAQTLTEEQPTKVRVTTNTNQVVVLDHPTIREESLVGVGPNARSTADSFETELTNIRSIEVWRVPPAVTKAQWLGTPIPIEQLCEDQVDRIRVTLADGRQVVLNNPRVEEDRVLGETDPYYTTQSSIPLSNVVKVEQRTTNSTAITIAIVGGLLVGALVFAAANSDWPLGSS